MEVVDRGLLKQLVEGRISDDDVDEMRRMTKKDHQRFWTYLDILQEKVTWDNTILMRLNDHLYIVMRGKERIVKCDCGHEYGDYRVNWKLHADIRTRDTQDSMEKVYYPTAAAPDADWMEVREFFCPGCTAQLAVEIVPPGYPLTFEAFPDLDRFYREFMNKPLVDESPDWFKDKTADYLSAL
ncbi:MAG: hypothetical protein KBT50_07570 [Cycloclasticus sp.]|nr:hypothetical protein [Cycloclasticus sp.]MBQ0790460.1 hypothetical protein [Cycloclasticus sp.]